MAAGIPVATLIDWIGHDGSEIMFPDLERGQRSFSAQECILALFSKLSVITLTVEVEQECFLTPEHSYVTHCDDKTLRELLSKTDAVVTGHIHGRAHSMAWCRESSRLLDPSGFIYPLDKMLISYIHLVFTRGPI